MAESTAERERRERKAVDDHMRRHKAHSEQQGKEVTHEQIQRHVSGVAERVEKEKKSKLYKDD